MSKKILQLISGDFEDLEVWYPVYRCREEGWQVDFAAEKPGLYHGKYGVPCEVALSFKDLDPDDYDGLLVPGGWAPDKLRRFPEVLDLVRRMNADAVLPSGSISTRSPRSCAPICRRLAKPLQSSTNSLACSSSREVIHASSRADLTDFRRTME